MFVFNRPYRKGAKFCDDIISPFAWGCLFNPQVHIVSSYAISRLDLAWGTVRQIFMCKLLTVDLIVGQKQDRYERMQEDYFAHVHISTETRIKHKALKLKQVQSKTKWNRTWGKKRSANEHNEIKYETAYYVGWKHDTLDYSVEWRREGWVVV